MQSWAPLTVPNVASATGDLTALFPYEMSAGSGSSAAGTLRRQSTNGILYRCEISPDDATGGYFELWDIQGNWFNEGSSANNTDTGSTLTNAFLTAKQALGEARMLWRVDFKGDPGNASKIFNQRVPVMFGLAARFVTDATTGPSAGTVSVTVSIVAEGCARKIVFLG